MSDDENRDTSDLPPPPQAPSESGEWHAMSDRELMLTILRKQTKIEGRLSDIEKRLGEGDGLFALMNGNMDLMVNSVRELCLERGRKDLAQRIDDDILRGRGNGAKNDEPTDPGMRQ